MKNDNERIRQILLSDQFNYDEVKFIEEDSIEEFTSLKFDVESSRYGMYEISVFSHDGINFETKG